LCFLMAFMYIFFPLCLQSPFCIFYFSNSSFWHFLGVKLFCELSWLYIVLTISDQWL